MATEEVTPQDAKPMTVKELLDSLPDEKREDMADFLYSRVPCGFIPKDSEPSEEDLPEAEYSRRKKCTEIEIDLMSKISNREFEEWFKERQGKSRLTTLP